MDRARLEGELQSWVKIALLPLLREGGLSSKPLAEQLAREVEELSRTDAEGIGEENSIVLRENVPRVMGAGQVHLGKTDFALDDEVWLEPSPGHTPDHVSIRLASQGRHAVMCGDLMHSPVQCRHPEWTVWPDWDADEAKRTRRAFLERYADTDTLVCTAHFPLPSAGRIVADGTAATLKGLVGVQRLTLTFAGEEQAELARQRLGGIRSAGPAVSLPLGEPARGRDYLNQAHDSSLAVTGVELTQPSLDDVFELLTRRQEADR